MTQKQGQDWISEDPQDDETWEGACKDCLKTFPVVELEQVPEPDGLIQLCRKCWRARLR